MTINNKYRIGFCCHLISNNIKIKDNKYIIRQYYPMKILRLSSTLNMNEVEIYNKIYEIIEYNLSMLYKQIVRISLMPINMRMFRINSELLPLYTHPDFSFIYRNQNIYNYIRKQLKIIGQKARDNRIRLSFHPAQFVILNSTNSEVVKNSINEINYHSKIAKYLGYTENHQDGFCINIHGGSKIGGLDNFKYNFKFLNKYSKNLLTVENDEIIYGPDQLVEELGNICPIVYDVHHHICKEKEFIYSNNILFKNIRKTWPNGIRPKIHYSLSQMNLLYDMDNLYENEIFNNEFEFYISDLSNHNISKIRKHSFNYWNKNFNEQIVLYLKYADIMCESKSKNIGSKIIYETALNIYK